MYDKTRVDMVANQASKQKIWKVMQSWTVLENILVGLMYIKCGHHIDSQGDELISQYLIHLPRKETSLLVYADEVCYHNNFILQ